MERLTKPLCGGYELPMIPMEIKTQDDLQKFHEVRKFYESCAIRCGQYEDSGLEPEEIKNALDVNDIIPEINVTVDHICDLLKAEQEGRLHITPAFVWHSGDSGLHKVPYKPWMEKWIATGTKFWLTREEAEAALALKGGESDA